LAALAAALFRPTFGGTVIAGIRNVNLSTIDITGIAFSRWASGILPNCLGCAVSQPNHLNLEWRTDYDPKTGNIVDSAVSAGGRWDNWFVNFGSNQLRTGTVLAPSSNQFTTLRSGSANRTSADGTWAGRCFMTIARRS